MKQIYSKLWELAKPYYEKGRDFDIDHVSWMMKTAEVVCEKENLDDSLLLPFIILHDIGYSELPKDNPFNLDLRVAHMESGAKLARELLEKVNYPTDKTEKIIYYISVHDRWALGDIDLYNDKILGTFNDLDFSWMATREGVSALMKILNKNHKEMVEFLESKDAKPVPFTSETIKKIFEDLVKERKK